ncbi:MAG: rhodanese-like domain-containing protein [Granulosicoccaceae bacterium]
MKLLNKRILILIALMTFGVIGNAFAGITHVNNATLAELIEQGVPVIDVRRADEWTDTGTIDGSHLITFFDKNGRYDADAWLAKLDKLVSIDEPFVLICAAGVRSRNIAQLLDARLGYTAVHNVKKGINHWIAKGQEVVPHSP